MRNLSKFHIFPTLGGIFKLPELVVHTNSSYLLRQSETRLECRIAGQPLGDWPNATLDPLLWLKDGTPISELNSNDVVVAAEGEAGSAWVFYHTNFLIN